jgi:hypothetical protein
MPAFITRSEQVMRDGIGAVMEDHMENNTALSRRRLLAHIPAVAAAAVPATVVALPGVATAVPGHLDGHQVRGLAEMLSALEGLPKGEANTVLKAITEVLECGMNSHAHDAPLMALKPKFDAAFEDWWARTDDSKRNLGRYPARTDEEIDEWADGLADLTAEVMGHRPITREGLALQCRALIMDGFDDWNDRTARFVGNMVLFFNWKLPDTLAVELLTWGQDWDDEDEEEDEEGNNNEA